MEINGRFYGFLWSIGAYCDYSDYVVSHGEVSVARANIEKAAIMSRAYCAANGGDPLTVAEINALPMYELDALMAAVGEAESAGNERTVESEEKKRKSEGRK